MMAKDLQMEEKKLHQVCFHVASFCIQLFALYIIEDILFRFKILLHIYEYPKWFS